MERLSFIKEYITKPRTVGAVIPSSKYLAHKMLENIDFGCANYIVEYGPGTGVFTKEMLQRRKSNTKILLLESNKAFYDLLMEKYKDEPNLYIINDSVEFIEKYLTRFDIPWIDYIISGLPFASLPIEVSAKILDLTRENLKEEGKFITFQYTLLKKEFIQRYFPEVSIKREMRNVPPAYVFCCGH